MRFSTRLHIGSERAQINQLELMVCCPGMRC